MSKISNSFNASAEKEISVFWHRRDLRVHDNAGLYHALKNGTNVQPVFIFDTSILGKLQNRSDARVTFIHQQLEKLNNAYQSFGSSLKVYHGKPLEIFKNISAENNIAAVFTNTDYEPAAIQRDKEVQALLKSQGISFHAHKDHVIFHENEILKPDGSPYTVFTPYSRKWKEKLSTFFLKSYPTEKYKDGLHTSEPRKIPDLHDIGFTPSSVEFPSANIPAAIIKNYDQTRDIPSLPGTSRVSVHLRFGTISIRELARESLKQNVKYLNELIWRDFYQMILFHFPHTPGSAFKPAYDHIKWRNNENEFKRWCAGETGFPLVDAGMRELHATGWMHNRVRMLVASFLTKHLLIDWRWGEACFAEKLIDYDMASNVGGWQWAAGCGNDAAPYFRIFSPDAQLKKFDPDLIYVRKWIPEFDSPQYPQPMVDHKYARERALKVFKDGLNAR